MAAALAAAHPEETWEVSHIGGDRFAGNLLVLPHGLYYGRLDPAAAARASPAPTWPASSTSTTCAAAPGCAMPVQAAEIALRRELGETRHRRRPVPVGAARDDDVTDGPVRRRRRAYAVRVRTTPRRRSSG